MVNQIYVCTCLDLKQPKIGFFTSVYIYRCATYSFTLTVASEATFVKLIH